MLSVWPETPVWLFLLVLRLVLVLVLEIPSVLDDETENENDDDMKRAFAGQILQDQVNNSLPANVFLLNPLPMLKTGILNPHVLSLLARVRHTNAIVIADRGFPFWPQIETVDISLVDDVPTVLQVLAAIRPAFHVAQAFMALEFLKHNKMKTRQTFAKSLAGIQVTHETHVRFKQRVPAAIGLIRTGDTTQYANMILISG